MSRGKDKEHRASTDHERAGHAARAAWEAGQRVLILRAVQRIRPDLRNLTGGDRQLAPTTINDMVAGVEATGLYRFVSISGGGRDEERGDRLETWATFVRVESRVEQVALLSEAARGTIGPPVTTGQIPGERVTR